MHLVEVPCANVDCSVAPAPESPRVDEPTAVQKASSAQFTFRQASDEGAPVVGYELRYVVPPPSFQLDETAFSQWTPAPAPDVAAPGTITTVTLDGLAPDTDYAVGLRARGACGWSGASVIRVRTAKMLYTKLSGLA